MSGDLETLLSGMRFRPRASLGPEIQGRVRRGEVGKGGLGPRRPPLLRQLIAAAGVLLAVPALALAWRAAYAPVHHSDHCCRDLDGGKAADDGYVVRSRGRTIESITLYEDLDGDRRFSAGDRVRLVRGRTPRLAGDSVHATIRICCDDLDGEGPADDGLLVLSGEDEQVVLAGVFERRDHVHDAELR